MSNIQTPAVAFAQEAPGLSQVQRVIYTFTAPTKTFNDIKRSTSWWLPFVLTVVFGYGLFGAIQSKVGWEQVAENSIKQNPTQAEQMDKLPPDQKASRMKITVIATEISFAALPIFALIGTAVIAGVLLATVNFGFGGKTTFWQAFSVTWFAGLPGLFKVILGTIALFVGLDPESFNVKNFAGTNIGYYLPPDTSKTLMALATSIDITTIWTLVLAGIGISIVAGIKRSSGYIAVFGWWLVTVVLSVGIAAAF
jgi:Yip1-like protein